MVLRVGLTGGIGSGKSTAAQIFELLGVPVYYADDAAKRIMHEDAVLKQKIREQFGTEAYTGDVLNRSFLAQKVFNDPFQLELLNSLVHPATILDAERWMQSQKTPYAIKEAALIFESGSSEHLDIVIGINAPEELRIQRIMKRNGWSYEQVAQRINQQLDEKIKMMLCDFVIRNDEQELLIPQVVRLHGQLLDIAGKKNAGT